VRVTVLASDPARWILETAQGWAAAGDLPTVVLLDAAAALARRGHPDADVVRAAQAGGVTVAVHDGALLRRGVAPAAVADGVTVVDLDEVADLVTTGADRALWY